MMTKQPCPQLASTVVTIAFWIVVVPGVFAMQEPDSRPTSRPASPSGAIEPLPTDRVELKDLVERFATEKELKAEIVRGPRELAHIAIIREKVKDKVALGDPVATDVVFWVPGAPKAPYHTKLLGAPYRPASAPWPQIGKKDAFFLAQWYFGDSKDIVKDLPGDVLLMFVDASDFSSTLDPKPSNVHFEWQKRGILDLEKKVVRGSEGFPSVEMHAVLCRSVEYPKLDPDDWDALDDYGNGFFVGQTQASRIGGDTWQIQGGDIRAGERLLATLNSIWPRKDVTHPFPNRENPLTKEEADRYEVMLGDVGCFYLYIDRAGKIRCEFDCY